MGFLEKLFGKRDQAAAPPPTAEGPQSLPLAQHEEPGEKRLEEFNRTRRYVNGSRTWGQNVTPILFANAWTKFQHCLCHWFSGGILKASFCGQLMAYQTTTKELAASAGQALGSTIFSKKPKAGIDILRFSP